MTTPLRIHTLLICLITLVLTGCVSHPKGVSPVTEFELDRYLGQWYEIARLDHSFERGLEKVSATYTLREDGGVKVLNKGFDVKKQEWEQAIGKAYFVEDTNTGFLKVSFFGPFYSSYIVFDLDTEYRTALVSGPNKSYFWILSRTPSITDEDLSELVSKAEKLGFNTSELIYVNHD